MDNKTFKRCPEDQAIFDGIAPGVILSFEDTRNGTEKYQDSMKVSKGEMSQHEFDEKHSLFYQKNPHLKTFSKG